MNDESWTTAVPKIYFRYKPVPAAAAAAVVLSQVFKNPVFLGKFPQYALFNRVPGNELESADIKRRHAKCTALMILPPEISYQDATWGMSNGFPWPLV